MKVLKHGKYYSRGRQTCPICECEFEYEFSDYTVITYSKTDIKKRFICPDCKSKFEVQFS